MYTGQKVTASEFDGIGIILYKMEWEEGDAENWYCVEHNNKRSYFPQSSLKGV